MTVRAEGFWWVRWRGLAGHHVMGLDCEGDPIRMWQEPRWRVVEVRNGHAVTTVANDDRWEWGPFVGATPLDMGEVRAKERKRIAEWLRGGEESIHGKPLRLLVAQPDLAAAIEAMGDEP